MLTDLEICKRIAEIEGLEFYLLESGGDTYPMTKLFTTDANKKEWSNSKDYNPLTDDALCFQLMIKYNVLREATGNKSFQAVICNWGSGSEYFRGTGETLNKAICLAIIESS